MTPREVQSVISLLPSETPARCRRQDNDTRPFQKIGMLPQIFQAGHPGPRSKGPHTSVDDTAFDPTGAVIRTPSACGARAYSPFSSRVADIMTTRERS